MAGDHVPVMPLVDVVGSTGAVVPWQKAGTALNVGTVPAPVTVTVKVATVAHWPVEGVNVYVPVAVLLTVAGDHVPVMPLVEVVGSTGAAEPLQIGPTALNVGIVVAMVKLRQPGGATLPQRSVTDPEAFVKQTW